MPPADLTGHTPGHINCPLCEPARLRIIAPAEFGLLRFRDGSRVWLGERRPELAEGSIRNYEHHFRWLNEFFGDMELNKIHIGNVQQYQEWRQQPHYDAAAKRTFRAGYSPINHECSALAQVLERAGLWLEIKKFYKPLKQPKARAGAALEPEEQERLFYMASAKPRWKVAYLCSLITANTTAGPKEIRYLHLGDINLTQRGGDGQAMPTMTIRDGLKNEHRDRTVFLNQTAVMAFKQLLKRAGRLGCSDPEHFLLPHRAYRRGEDVDPNRPMGSWKRAFQAMREAAGLPKLRPYDLRHHAITRVLENPEVSEQTAKEIAGQVSKRILNRYSHIRMRKKRDALIAAETRAPAVQLGLSFDNPDRRKESQAVRVDNENTEEV